jgi:eukaryotic-like serine/threonine-protein kinase
MGRRTTGESTEYTYRQGRGSALLDRRIEKRATIREASVSSDAINVSPLAPGYKLDRYELLCPIAEGGMASVWVARQRGKHGFEKVVAIKTILPKFAGDVRFQDMFLDEARIASRIEHANVAQIFDLGEEHEILYLAMEYVEGDALSKINRACAKKGLRIPTGVLLRVLADTCAGLHEAHEMKDSSGRRLDIVHRDVSPHNILVSTKGVAKLIDFGIATAQSRAQAETSSGVLKGKIQYMAPEQALGRPLDRRADVWAVGAVLYALLSGRPPYEADNPLATLNLLGSGRPPMPLPSTVHPSIAAIVRRALSFSPEQRHATAADLRDAIERAIISSQNIATIADVAAFAAEHVSDRVEKRRHAIELALAAAAERQQAEEQYRPIERRSTSILPGATITNPPWPPPSSGALPSPIPLVHRTVAEVPAAKPPTLETLARLTPRLSEPPQAQVSSYATLGSAALETSETSLQAPRSRWGMVAVATAVLFVGAVGAGIASNVFRPAAAPSPASSSMVVQPAQTIPRPAAQPPNAFASVPPSDSASSWPLLATVNASALPRAATATQPPVYPYPQSRRTPVGPAAPASGVKPKKPDDSDDSETETPPTPAQTAAPPPPPVVETPPPAPAPAPPAKSKAFDDGF